MKRVLITGAYGFLGRHTARKFKDSGCHVTGIGHGKWYLEEYTKWGIDTWLESTITFESLMNINERFDIIVHCGGSGSVAFSHSNPYEDFQKSVQSTLSLLEYIRLQAPKCKFIYPSSPAVQGNLQDLPIQENIISNPISPYGFNKKIAEELCLSYRNNYDLDIGIIRFFSIYGKGLQKQLIYDACKKIVTTNVDEIIFFGTGKETRDWINVEDAGALIVKFSDAFVGWDVVNGASGVRTEIQEILRLVAIQFDRPLKITFNGVTREGDPKYFWADMTHTLTYDWNPKVVLADGIAEYVEYFKQLKL
ncbi:SDR family oxidoreductase [Pedobacter sp. ASV1-7]|uniref:NAD-dependent epimerase/dehydratase family protein n=1 Tax=Pedobacter sp. ASV1-7 TaxID=3145237 RepID=UPI0032E8519E